jgi:Patatin-like phospholipase
MRLIPLERNSVNRLVFSKLFVLSLISGCATVRVEHLPPRDLQPSVLGVPSELTRAIDAHSRWLESTTSHRESSPQSQDRKALRLRGAINKSPAEASTIVESNVAMSEYFRTSESRVYRSKNLQPTVCVALSGGGVRAAAFGVGVLQGLHESGKLQDVDVVSAVSGGAYALTWYSENKARGRSDLEVLSDDYIKKSINPSLFSLPVAVLSVLFSPGNAFLSGASDINGIDSSTVKSAYYGMLSNSFGASAFRPLNTNLLRVAVENGTIPLPILGIAAYPLPGRLGDLDPKQAVSSYAKSVAFNDTYLEVTPYRFGIQGFGFHQKPPTPLSDDFWQYVMVSGAAYDRPHENGSVGRLSGVLRIGGMMSLAMHRQYLSGAFSEDTNSVYRHLFYATDGGFVENLATFPLVLRQCSTIVIADSEYDPEWVMEGYTVLKNRLFAEHGIELKVEGIDKSLSRLVAGVQPMKRNDGLELLFTEKECARPNGTSPCRARDAVTNVFYGTLTKIPTSVLDVEEGRTTRIIYLKLGLPKNNLAAGLPTSVRDFMSECMRSPEQCHFPQDPTFVKNAPTESQKYTQPQFKAYKDLARYMIKTVEW